MLNQAILSFVIVSFMSPGINELNPCFQYGLFEVNENDAEKVLKGISKLFEDEGWTCRSKKIPAGIECERGQGQLRTRAVCETAITGSFKYYYSLRRNKESELEQFVGEFRIPRPINDDFSGLSDN